MTRAAIRCKQRYLISAEIANIHRHKPILWRAISGRNRLQEALLSRDKSAFLAVRHYNAFFPKLGSLGRQTRLFYTSYILQHLVRTSPGAG